MALGTGTGVGSISPIFDKLSETNSIFSFKSNGRIGFKIDWVMEKGVSQNQKQLLLDLKDKLKKIGITPPANPNDSKYLSIDELTPIADQLLKIFKESLA